MSQRQDQQVDPAGVETPVEQELQFEHRQGQGQGQRWAWLGMVAIIPQPESAGD